jgi:UDP-N-acetylglucosamine 1-carboxyvinyltransferase
MAQFVIEGGHSLRGTITVAGNKNAALPIIAATILTDEECYLENMPHIRDIEVMHLLLKDLGKNIDRISPNSYKISGTLKKSALDPILAKGLRASILYMGALLAKAGHVQMVPPGGCVIGRRNVDGHFQVFEELGAKIKSEQGVYIADLKNARAANIFLHEASVTATENALLLAAKIPEETIIMNAACEPHVEDLAKVLNKMGAQIQGAGTNQIKITGAKKLSGFKHRIVPDHIEASTFAIAAACTNGKVRIEQVCKDHMIMVAYHLTKMGVKFRFSGENVLEVFPSEKISRLNKVQVSLWPGFPTDLMSPFIILATQAKGITLCHDWMYESRMFFVDKLIAMGAQITQCDPHRVLVYGPTKLKAQNLSSPDIRAGIALIIAAMVADGESTIDKVELIDRGYEHIEDRFNQLGSKIKRIN